MTTILDKILGLRPKKNDAASLREALARAVESRTEILTRIEVLERARGALMMRGTAAEMRAGEDDLAAARLDADRLSSLIKSLEDEGPAAEKREFLDKLKSAVDGAQSLRVEFLRRWRKEYATAAGQIVALLELERRAEDARAAVIHMSSNAVHDRGIDGDALAAALVGFPGTNAAHELSKVLDLGSSTDPWPMGQYIHLPGDAQQGTGDILAYPLWPQRGSRG